MTPSIPYKQTPGDHESLCRTAHKALRYGTSSLLEAFPGLIRKIIETEAWREREVRPRLVVKLDCFMDLIVRQPPDGWGENPSKIEKVLSDDPDVLALWRESTKRKPGPKGDDNYHDNIMVIDPDKAQQGTSKSYTLSRLKREAPELYERVCNRELSANAAAIEAGLRKIPSALQQAQRWYNKLSEDEREQFKDWISIVRT